MFNANSYMMINKPTRFPIGEQRGAPSLIDHLYVNDPDLVTTSGLITSDISDHMPIFSVFKTGINKNAMTERYLINDFSNFSIDVFHNELSKFDIDIHQNLPIDEKFTAFHNHFQKCVDKCAPLRKVSRKEFKSRQTPWISNSLETSINFKNWLYILIRHHNPSDLEQYYKRYKKTLEKTLKRCKKEYLALKIANAENSSK